MKTSIFTTIEKILKLWQLYVILGVLATSYIGFFSGILTMRVNIAVWFLIIISIAPLLFFMLCRYVYLRKKRMYSTGTLVQIIADERKFVAIRYLFWLPNHVVCKQHNTSAIIAVHQKYLTTYKEPTEFNPLRAFEPPNINTAVPTVTITKL